MEFEFYLAAAIALFATIRAITNTNPVHGLLYLIVSLFAIAIIFFIIGAPFVGALEIVVYAGTIMVLFMFVIMMLNLGKDVIQQEQQWTLPDLWIGPGLLSGILLLQLLYAIWTSKLHTEAGTTNIDVHQVSITLYGAYLLCVELASLLLLAALVAAYHLGRTTENE
ncbi:NADH dehydrogenase [Achromatium sp. WMS1]|nr:NADH dehydrogenase [Achromatium sp. WMS1]